MELKSINVVVQLFTENYTLVEGKNEFLIEAEDYKGNKSSLTLIVFLDKTLLNSMQIYQ